MGLERNIVNLAAGQVFNAEGNFVGGGSSLGIELACFTSHHGRNNFVNVGVCNIFDDDGFTITHNGETITQFKDLFKAVRYINNGDALFF